MKKFLMATIASTFLFSSTAKASNMEGVLYAYIGGSVTIASTVGAVAVVYPVPVTVTGLAIAVTKVVDGDIFFYRGLKDQSLEVLAFDTPISELPELSVFKEELVNNSEEFEAALSEQGYDLSVNELSDRNIAHLAYLLQK